MEKFLQCRLCGALAKQKFKARLLGKYDITYFMCHRCKLLQTEEPYWLKEAYEKCINISDTGLLQRSLYLRNIASVILYYLDSGKASYLDYGAGYGIFVRLMRDTGFDYYWYDEYAENIVASGFEGELRYQYGAVTAFEVLEHLVNPSEALDLMLSCSDTLVFSTRLYGDSVPAIDSWHYYGCGHGQHIAFYCFETLQFIADKYKLSLSTDKRWLHVLKRGSIPKHLVILAKWVSKIGFSRFVNLLLKSKTLSDWERLSVLEQRAVDNRVQ